MAAIVGIDAEILYVSTTTLEGVTAGEIIAVQINDGGTGYTASDVLTVAGGTGGQLTVDSVSTGVITAVSVTAAGSGYSETKAAAVTGGTGRHLRFAYQRVH